MNCFAEGTITMTRMLAVLSLFLLPSVVDSCSYCDPSFMRRLTYREDARAARFVVLARATDSKLNSDMTAETTLQIETVVKNDPFLKNRKSLSLPRYLPIDPKKPPLFLLFGDLFNDKADLYRGVPISDPKLNDYLAEVVKLDDRESVKSLKFYFAHLDSGVPEIAADAFLEFAKASDAQVAAVAPQLESQKLRKLLLDAKTPPERLSLFAYLLGSCGQAKDAAFFKELLAKNDSRTQASLAGLLGGLIELNPEEGWKATQQILLDSKQSFANRLSAINTVRFYQTCQPKAQRTRILACLKGAILDGELADMAIEDLRRWSWWDHTALILEQTPKETHVAPIVQRAIVRYALSCPEDRCRAFVATYRKSNPMLVKEVEEGLEFDQPKNEKK
jgi:hypothetical protein